VSHDSADIIVGRIVGVHGIRGQVKVHSDCRPRESLFQYRQFIARQNGRPDIALQLLRGQTSGKGLVAAFTGINDRDQALALGGYTLYISRDQLPAPQDGEYYWADLIGLRVENRQGIALGRVSELFETGANDILVVKADNSKAEILIPFVRPRYVEAIDLANGLMRVDWETEWSQVGADDISPAAFAVPVHRAVFEAVEAAGGTGEVSDLISRAESPGLTRADAVDRATVHWIEQVRAGAIGHE